MYSFVPDKSTVAAAWPETASENSLQISDCSLGASPAEQKDALTGYWLIKNLREEQCQAAAKTHQHRLHSTEALIKSTVMITSKTKILQEKKNDFVYY